MTILDRIIDNKRRELAIIKERNPIAELEKSRYFTRDTLPLSRFLTDAGKTGIIAEFKRKSPSKGIINKKADVREVSKGYTLEGASGLSILTDIKFFGGTINDLKIAREINTIPILRKDFIIDEFQVVQSKAAGADAILLIAAALEAEQITRLAEMSHSLGMEVVLEVRGPDELFKLSEYIDIIGVNNRDLRTFIVDINVSIDMADKIPQQFLKITESGILSPATLIKLRLAGYNGFLMGELFMRREDPVFAFSEFINEVKHNYGKN
jgi:indole-3-glycerol phosphate synthase